MAEGDSLANSGQFAPMTMKQRLPDDVEIPFSEDSDELEDNFDQHAETVVVSLLCATDEKAYTLGYSEKEGGWMKVVEEDADEYDHERLEQETHEFVKRHSESSLEDGGFVQ